MPTSAGGKPAGNSPALPDCSDIPNGSLVRYVGPDACPACGGWGLTQPMADFFGDDPATMRVCTVSYCERCGGTGRDAKLADCPSAAAEIWRNGPRGKDSARKGEELCNV